MRKKRLYVKLSVLVLIVFTIISLLSAGCHLVGIKSTAEEAEEEIERIEAEQKAEEQAEAEEAALTEEAAVTEENTEEEAATSEKEGSLPNEPITYTGSIGEAGEVPITIILTVDFKTKEVTGSINLSGDGEYVNAAIDGKININTFEITSKYSGAGGDKETEMPVNGTITGKITKDLSTFNGEMKSEYGAKEFTATRE